ncbi:MAG: leucyl aminopeptidase [Firmicutes bacterium]|uniref:Probable cytosol aminopeptidase n=1 Tax=Sulfobacillus benefaciens TaxID=453960 RepID=A0A2T2WW46_9FIRM|nr:leucyl aminopeptidase [Bacillota bacterium]MCL5013523.1 leucyl aminopeptidase [Bacillota bacterium]PSR26442.1 MAG: leucyl aminopeptidase [Sulfobacillus benefaciens]
MKVEIKTADAFSVPAELVAVGVYQNDNGNRPEHIPQDYQGLLNDAVARGEFEGKLMQTLNVLPAPASPSRRVLFIGLGREAEVTAQTIRKIFGHLAQITEKTKIRSVAMSIPVGQFSEEDAVTSAAEGWLLGAWQFEGYHQDSKERNLPDLYLSGITQLELAQKALDFGLMVATQQNLTRDLGYRPSNLLYPELLAEEAVRAGTRHGFSVEVFDENKLRELGMGALLGVGQGSVHPPRLVVMRYDAHADKTLALVGKGITFDSGGISLKPPTAMEEMKYDMLGAGAVLGAMCAIAETKPRVNVIGLMAIAQNMPSGSAYKPGDVVRAFNGKTIEITNTDAEGRVALADAVSYAAHLHADWIVETSTLTGAVLVVLGHEATGMVADDDKLAEQVIRAGEAVGERIWRLPIYPEYKDLYKSKVADIKNSPGRDAGTITGGMIIREFAGGIPFVHLDIAGSAWTKTGPLNAVDGATGVMVRTFVELAHKIS